MLKDGEVLVAMQAESLNYGDSAPVKGKQLLV